MISLVGSNQKWFAKSTRISTWFHPLNSTRFQQLVSTWFHWLDPTKNGLQNLHVFQPDFTVGFNLISKLRACWVGSYLARPKWLALLPVKPTQNLWLETKLANQRENDRGSLLKDIAKKLVPLKYFRKRIKVDHNRTNAKSRWQNFAIF